MIHKRASDPVYHFNNGRDWEASGNWSTALNNYQKALSCIPQMIGGNSRFQLYLRDNNDAIDVSRELIAQVYASLGRCYVSKEMIESAWLSYKAAAQWHPTQENVSQLNNIAHRVKEKNACTVGEDPCNPDEIRTMDQLTIVMITHYTNKLIKYKELSPPSTKLIAITHQSLLSFFGAPVSFCPKILCYDLPKRPDGESRQYTKSLEIFSRSHGFNMLTFHNLGLHAILQEVMPGIKTPFVALIEHDWLFQGPPVSLTNLLKIFFNDPAIHHVRFNKRKNHITGWDFIMEAESQVPSVPLLRTSAFSNNPCIMRTEKMVNDWLPMAASETDIASRCKKGSAVGMEEPLFKNYIQDIRQHGFSNTHRRWGTYLYGDVCDSPRIVHLGE
jgi:hypothetical protein